jgi:hypothetical protein
MTAVSILPENAGANGTTYRAVAVGMQSVGRTPGEALDALTSQLGEAADSMLVVVQRLRPDRFFNAVQQQRLEELMTRWRMARDSGSALPAAEQAELDALIDAEVKAAGQRAAALINELAS